MRISSKGFTLIELLVVIGIVGVLAVVLLIVVNPLTQLKKARDAGRKTSLKQIQNVLEQYFSDTGGYPVTSCWSGAACWTVGAGSFLGAKASNYATSLPLDPAQTGADCTTATSKGYYYYTADLGKTYKLIAAIENTQDAAVLPGASTYYSAASDGGGCSTAFNYKLVSQQQ